ncbi:hypothetical protein [Streptomyces sp. NPDC003023]|uniref:hypothetical protein n=1 Tax=Streptomyces sp. NPDC003023 TaxID=3364675 RepID=UPI0036801F5F
MRGIGPRRAITTVVALAGGAFLVGASLLRLETQLSGVAGSFTAESCARPEYGDSDDGLECTGTFEAGDGSFRITGVEVDTTFEEEPSSPVATAVDGPSATTAVLDENRVWLLPGGTGLLIFGVGAWNVYSALRRPRDTTRATGGGVAAGPQQSAGTPS